MDLANPDDEVQRLSSGMVLIESASYESLFPAERKCHVHLVLRDGRRLESPITTAVGGPDNPPHAAAVTAKYSALTDDVLGSRRAAQLRDTICALPDVPTMDLLSQILAWT
jgi:2-methylcitrate dehydratase PrpD